MMLYIEKRPSTNSPSSLYNRPATLGTHPFSEAAHLFVLYRTFPDIDLHACVSPQNFSRDLKIKLNNTTI